MNVFFGKKVVITGHCGFKGSWLSAWLIELGAKVYGISLEVPSHPSMFEELNLASKLEDNRFDICENIRLESKLADIAPDYVFHLAAQPLVKQSYLDPIETWRSNLMGTVSVLNSLKVINHQCVVIFITSDKCYDNVEWIWGYRETDALGGPDPYSASKGAAELAIKSFVKSYFPKDGAVRIGIGRAGNVIGGGDWAADRIIPDCVRAWSRKETVDIRRPNATRPWQHVLEPLSGYLKLAEALSVASTLHGEAFNFGPNLDQNYSVKDVVERVKLSWPEANWRDTSEGDSGPYESGLLKLNCDKALHYLSWRAALDFSETISLTADWYKAFYAGFDMAAITQKQIAFYKGVAQSRGISWAQ